MLFRFLVILVVLVVAACGGDKKSRPSTPPTPVNHAPSAQNGSNTVAYSKTVSGTLQASDQDAGTTLTYSIVSQPSTGTITLTGNSYTYVNQNETEPDINDSFTFKANDGKLDSNTAQVSIVTEGKENARFRDRNKLIQLKNERNTAILLENPKMVHSDFWGIDLSKHGSNKDVLELRQDFDDPSGPNSPFGRNVGPMTIYRYLGLGEGFASEPVGANGFARNSFLADFDNNGTIDIFMGNHGLDRAPPEEMIGTQSQLFFQTTDGKLVEKTTTNLPQEKMFTHAVCGGDVNGDKHIDLMYGDLGTIGQRLYINDGNGVFTPTKTGLTDDVTSFKHRTTSCKMVDINNDNNLDIIFGVLLDAYAVSRDIIVAYGNGLGDFTNTVNLTVSGDPERMATLDINLGDLTGDNCADISVLNTGNYLQSDDDWWIDVYAGNCSGTYSSTPIKLPSKIGIGYFNIISSTEIVGYKKPFMNLKKVDSTWSAELFQLEKHNLSQFEPYLWIN